MMDKSKGRIKNFIIGFIVLVSWTFLCADVDDASVIKNHKISIELIPEKHSFNASDEMLITHTSEQISLYINKDFKINFIKVSGKKRDFRFDQDLEQRKPQKLLDDNLSSDFTRAGILTIDAKTPGEHVVLLDYSGIVYDEPGTSEFSREYIANQTSGIIGRNGTFLSPDSFWYAKGNEQLCLFEIQTTTPLGYETITQGKRLRREENSGRLVTHWKNSNPSDVLFLQAGPYEIREDEIEGIKVYTYFFEGSEKLTSLYLSKSKLYIAMYNRLLGSYPYSKFAVVENFFETGFGMPSWTLLGSTVIRLPFIPDTSLPHEICHNWWGNGVFVDHDSGNWCEGLTVYCADYLLKREMVQGGDVEYRRQMNRDFASYVKENNDFPLIEFKTRYNPASRAVGYGKAMMVFHTLQRMVGEEIFIEALRQLMAEFKFERVGWKDILGLFEKEGGIDLSNFYKTWIERAGAPVLRIEGVWAQRQRSEYSVTFNIIQKEDIYDLDVPVLLTTEDGEVRKNFKVGNPIESCEILSPSKPVRLEVDPDHHLFRRLYPEEIPPSIAKVFGAKKQLIVLGSLGDAERLEEYRVSANMINRTETAEIKIDIDVTSEELNDQSVIFLGDVSEESEALKFLNSLKSEIPWDEKMLGKADTGRVVVYRHPDNKKHSVMTIDGNNQSDIRSIARKLPHYGKYSYLLFQGENNIDKGIWRIESSPLIFNFK